MISMSRLEENNWFIGTGQAIGFEELVLIAKEHVSKGSKIFIGSDSFIVKQRINFATAICLYGGGHPSRYFFTKNYENLQKYTALFNRMLEEATRTVELANLLYTKMGIDPKDIEIHLDVSPFESKTRTSKFSESLQGYVKGAGYKCKIKPEAWASQSVADKHSK